MESQDGPVTAGDMILLTGFGPFLDVDDNPSAGIVRALHGRRIVGETVVGEVLPVSYERAPARTIALARALSPRLVLGLGVARGRDEASVECVGRRVVGATPDVDDRLPAALADGPDEVPASIDVRHLAEALGASLSTDAGRYVCNAWLYRVAGALRVPVGFVHVPLEGVPVDTLQAAVTSLLRGGD